MENQKIVDESLKEESTFSSCTHGIDAITADNHVNHSSHYVIPDRYNQDRVVILPVNTKKYYLYWEITPSLLEKYALHSCNDILFRIVDELDKMVFEIHCHSEVAEYFVNQEFNCRSIKVFAGFYRENTFVAMLQSNQLKLFDKKLKFSDKQKEVWIKKEKGFTEVIRASMQHFTLGLSSASYVEEIERLKQFEAEMIKHYSSDSLVKGS
ncbi:MAG: DUF4912 domain-containing protein [Campylobacterales bacterium]|nr:DUF4912 domain-containing protein [Campylobacterales bacterium]